MNAKIYALRKNDLRKFVYREGNKIFIVYNERYIDVDEKDLKLLIKRMKQCYDDNGGDKE